MKKTVFGFLVLFLVSASAAMATTYSIADISVGTGKLDIYVAGGELRVSVDEDNKIFTVSTYIKDVAGNKTQEYLPLAKLMTGTPIVFPSEKDKTVLIKITGQDDFGPFGGHVKISMKKSEGWSSEILQIARASNSNTYYLWKDNKKVSEIGVNGKSEYVNWYEIE